MLEESDGNAEMPCPANIDPAVVIPSGSILTHIAIAPI